MENEYSRFIFNTVIYSQVQVGYAKEASIIQQTMLFSLYIMVALSLLMPLLSIAQPTVNVTHPQQPPTVHQLAEDSQAETRHTSRKEIQHGTDYSIGNYCGAQISSGGDTVVSVNGKWTVPELYFRQGYDATAGHSQSLAQWVGIDGINCSTLVQAGTLASVSIAILSSHENTRFFLLNASPLLLHRQDLINL